MGDGVDRVDWVQGSLVDACRIVMGQSPDSSSYSRENKGLPFFQGKKEFGALHPVPSVYCDAPKKIAEVGAVLLSVRAPVGSTNIALERSCIGRGLAALHPSDHIKPLYIFYFLRSRQNVLSDAGAGSTFKAVSKDFVEGYDIPLPPLIEQRAIVAKIEALFSELDKGVEQLETLRGQLKRYRQSVLKAAFEGRLTAAWRASQSQEPERLIAAESPAAYDAKNHPPMTEAELADLSELPEGWRWVFSDLLFSFVTSGSRGWAKYYSDQGAIFLRMGNLDHGTVTLDLRDIQHVNPPPNAEGNRTKVRPNDILISITADVGMIGVVPQNIREAYINQHVSLARPVDNLLPLYLAWFLSSQEGGQRQFRQLQRGATKVGLGLDDIRSIFVPLAPLPEQHQIVAEIESRFSALDQLEQTVEAGLKQAEALRQSILKKAFEGRLLSASESAAVRADPDYEPAAKLLERIRGEREKGLNARTQGSKGNVKGKEGRHER